MKPRTKIQKRIVSLSNQLYGSYSYERKPIKEVRDWVEENLIEYPTCITKSGVVTCLNCMGKFNLPKGYRKKKAICHTCGKEVMLTERRLKQVNDEFYFTILNTIEEFQVVQNYLCIASFRPKKGNSITYFEVDRTFVDRDLNFYTITRSRLMNGNISFSSDMEIRDRLFFPITSGVYPGSRVLPFFKKRGLKNSLFNYNSKNKCCVISLIDDLSRNSIVETLIKSGYVRLYMETQRSLYTMNRSFDSYAVQSCWASIKIAIRNRYHAYDWSIWFDHLGMLRNEGKDLRNAHYVCPRNLKLEHQKLIDKARKLREKEEQERKIEQMLKDQEAEKEFIERIKKFKDLMIAERDISITPLKDLEDFKNESDALKHCVFASKYYKKKNSLILSARVGNKRTETIEYNLSSKEVIQCRGLQNSSSEYHDKILKVLERNVSQINKRI